MKECFAEVKCVFRAPAGNHDVTACLTSSESSPRLAGVGLVGALGSYKIHFAVTHTRSKLGNCLCLLSSTPSWERLVKLIFFPCLATSYDETTRVSLGIIHLNAGQLFSCMHFGSSKIISKNAKQAQSPRSIAQKF